MKTTNIYSSGIARFGALIVAMLGLSLVSAFAGRDKVVLDLGGTQIGPGHVVDVTSLRRLNAAAKYEFVISGTCHTTGDFVGVLVDGTPLSTLLSRKTRKGSYINTGGTNSFVAVDKPFSKTVTITNPFPFSVTVTAHLKIEVTNGKVNLRIDQFTQNSGFPVQGSVFFEPGTKLVIKVVP